MLSTYLILIHVTNKEQYVFTKDIEILAFERWISNRYFHPGEHTYTNMYKGTGEKGCIGTGRKQSLYSTYDKIVKFSQYFFFVKLT